VYSSDEHEVGELNTMKNFTGDSSELINQFEGLGAVQNQSNQTENSGFKYNQFYVARAVMIPSIIVMILFSVILIYIIIRHLQPMMKLYMSVIFYALSILYFAALIITKLFYDRVLK
jgi:hypothetical protein